MAIFAFYPANAIDRRADGLNFAMTEGADEATARLAAATLIGASDIDNWTAVAVQTGMEPVAVEGLPVGAHDGTTWPNRTRGNRALNS